tara:strand:- start:115 stop:1008 length:894 start_codon:yes stop_codon:yes gene_type:complete
MAIGYAGNSTTGSSAGDLTGASLDVFVPEMWADSIYKYFEKNLVFKPFFDDYSSLVQGKGDAINIPEIQETTVATKSANTGVTYTTNTETSLQLLVDKHKYSAKMFEDIAMIQSNEQLFTKYSQSMSYGLAKAVDTDIETALQSIQDSVSLSANNTLSKAKAEEAYATILGNDIDPAECAWFLNPTLYADVVANSGFTVGGTAEGFSGGQLSGNIGTLYGMPVFSTSLVSSGSGTGTEAGYLVHKSAVAVAVQQDIRVQSDYDISHLATSVVADVIYGVKLTDSSNHKKGVKLNQNS